MVLGFVASLVCRVSRANAATLLLAASIAMLGGCATADLNDDAAATAPLTQAGDQAMAGLEASRAKLDDQSAALARQMADLGGALTADQQRKYATAFAALPEVARTTEEFERSAAALDRELRALITSPAKLASMRGRWGGDSGLYEAFKTLATTRYAGTSIVFASHILGRDPAYSWVRVSPSQVVREVLTPALPGAFAGLLLTTGSASSAVSELRRLFEASDGKGDEALAWIETYRTFSGTYGDATTILAIEDEPIGKALKPIGAILAMWEVGDGVSQLTRGNARAALDRFVNGGPESVAALAEGTSAIRRVMFGIAETPFAEKVIKVAGKVGAALGVVAGIIATIEDLKKWDGSGDAKLRVLGDVVSIGAAVLTLVGVASGGAVLGVAALGISLLAEYFHDQRLAREDALQKAPCLAAVFPSDPALAHTLAIAQAAEIEILSKDFAMSPEVVQRTAKVYPDALTHEKWQAMPLRWIGLLVMKDIFVLTGSEIATVLEKIAGAETNPDAREYKLHFFVSYLADGGGWDGTSLTSRSAALAWLRSREQSETFKLLGWRLGSAAWQKVVADVTGYLQSVPAR